MGTPARLASSLAVALAVCCSAAADVYREWPESWRSPLAAGHPLLGRIWSPREAQFIARQRLREALAATPVVLLGEVHDNPDHHRIQAWAVGAVAEVAKSGSLAVVFEQIRADQQHAVDRFAQTSAGSRTSAQLFRVLAWEETGWPSAEIYRPLFEVVIASSAAILAGHPARERVQAVAKAGAVALDPWERVRLDLDRPLPPALGDSLLEELAESHCRLMPKSALANVAEAQRYRDAHLARAVADAADRHDHVILIAGNGHVRRDRGVPWHLERMAPGKPVVSVVLAEVEAGQDDATAYGESRLGWERFADYVVFTPPAERPDPCEKMREHMGRKAGRR
ncbi:MAG TPA: ChaN family lipoprotein [Hyphomicrobiaceae bacterium]|nr:ChaN family lipoprotein [Hyphomicrobiaceae bacterium]